MALTNIRYHGQTNINKLLNKNPKPELVLPSFPLSRFLHCCHVASPSSYWVAMSITGCLGARQTIQWKSNESQYPLLFHLIVCLAPRHPIILITTQWSLPIKLSRGPEGPSRWPKVTSPPQELEVGACRAPYLLVNNIWTNISFGLVIFLNYPEYE